GVRKKRVQSRALGLGSAQFVAILAHNLVSACSRHLTKVEQLRLDTLVGSRYSDVEDGSLHVFMRSFFHPLTLCSRQPVLALNQLDGLPIAAVEQNRLRIELCLESCPLQAGSCLRHVQHHKKVAGELVLLERKLEKRNARPEKGDLRIHYVFPLRNEAVEGLALSGFGCLQLFGNLREFAVIRENLFQFVQCHLPPVGVFVSQFQI